MKMKSLFLILALSTSSIAFAQSDIDLGDDGKPIPAQIFPDDIEKTEEDSRRNAREVKEMDRRSRENPEPPTTKPE